MQNRPTSAKKTKPETSKKKEKGQQNLQSIENLRKEAIHLYSNQVRDKNARKIEQQKRSFTVRKRGPSTDEKDSKDKQVDITAIDGNS